VLQSGIRDVFREFVVVETLQCGNETQLGGWVCYMEWKGKARYHMERHDMAWKGETLQGKAWYGIANHGMEWHGK
jgi:hypothetical protein